MKALLIPIDGLPRAVDLPGGGGTRFMRSLRTIIGTQCAERIRVTSRWEAWLDEDGAAARKPANQAATLLAHGVHPVQAHTATMVPITAAMAPTMMANATIIPLFRSLAHQPSFADSPLAAALLASPPAMTASRPACADWPPVALPPEPNTVTGPDARPPVVTFVPPSPACWGP